MIAVKIRILSREIRIFYFYRFAPLWPYSIFKKFKKVLVNTVKHGDKEQIGVRAASGLHKYKEHLALRNNFRATKKFLITTP